MAETLSIVDPRNLADYVGLLGRSQHWPAEELWDYQEEVLERLLVHAWRNVPFYSERLKPLFRRRFGPHLHKWDQVPPLTRREVQAHAADLVSRTVPEEHGEAFEYTTSGSAGQPVTVRRTQLAVLIDEALQYRRHGWLGLDFERTQAWVLDLPGHAGAEWRRGDHWSSVAAALGHTGQRIDINPLIDPARQLEILNAERPDYLLAFPTGFRALARLCLDRPDIGWAPLATLGGGEAAGEDVQALVEAAWGCRINAMYSSRDAGHLAGQCEANGGYHVLAEKMRLEVVDEGYKLVPPGVSGRVLATPLHNFAMPLIRYEIGDAATFAAAPCPCGRTLPLLASFDGRTPQRIRFPDGATAWPLLDFSSILDPARIHRHQLVYDGAWGIELRYAAASELSAKERAEAHAALKDRLHPDIEVTFAFRPDLAQVRARKFRTFLRKSDE